MKGVHWIWKRDYLNISFKSKCLSTNIIKNFFGYVCENFKICFSTSTGTVQRKAWDITKCAIYGRCAATKHQPYLRLI